MVKVVNIEYKNHPIYEGVDGYRAELDYIYESDKRNTFLTQLCSKLENNTLILVNHISHGVNLSEYLIFAAGGKSFVRTVQSIGRGLRKHDSKDKLVIFDISDRLRYGIRHSEKRKEIYQREKIKYVEKNIS